MASNAFKLTTMFGENFEIYTSQMARMAFNHIPAGRFDVRWTTGGGKKDPPVEKVLLLGPRENHLAQL